MHLNFNINIKILGKLLIAGIDPGTVGAYALLDIEGNIIHIDSGREFNLSKIALEITKHGKVFIIGCDVYQCPSLTKKLASIIGAKIIIVNEFLKTKKEFIELKNKHEKDALAAALYGLKKTKTLIKKIDDHLKQNNKKHLFEEVKRRVLLEGTPIAKAVKSLS